MNALENQNKTSRGKEERYSFVSPVHEILPVPYSMIATLHVTSKPFDVGT